MSTTFQRAPLTKFLLDYLTALEMGPQNLSFPAGDAVIPQDSGWGTGEPNKPGSKFKPYFVLSTMTATPAPGTGSIANPQEDWHVPYLLQAFGSSRIQAETLMDWTRASMDSLTHQIIDLHSLAVPAPNNFKVQQVWQQSIGGVNVTPGSDPMFYGEQDQFTLWLAKRRT